MAVSRRGFLIGAGVTGGALAAGGAAALRSGDLLTTAALWTLATTLVDSASARDIGVEYLRRHPDEASEPALALRVNALLGRFSGLDDPQRVRERFHTQVGADFERGNVLTFGGWRLSRTGVRLCALAAVRSQARSGVSGVFAPQPLGDGTTFSWLTPDAAFLVPLSEKSLDVQLRSGAPAPQRVRITIDGTAHEAVVSGPDWQSFRYDVPQSAQLVRVGIHTTPAWDPANDFRVLGVGLKTTAWSSWG